MDNRTYDKTSSDRVVKSDRLLERTKELLKKPGSLLDVTYQTGLSSTGRLHDLFVNTESVTPDEFRKQGKDITIRYGFYSSQFGECLIAITDRGVSNLAFVQEGGKSRALSGLKKQWKQATVTQDQELTGEYAAKIFASRRHRGINLALKGTNFQVKAWQALLNIPRGRVSTYENVAATIGRPDVVRAVADAVACNPLASPATGSYARPEPLAVITGELSVKKRCSRGKRDETSLKLEQFGVKHFKS